MISDALGSRLFLVGGSSVGYGISASTIQEKTGIPTYNYSFWAPLGPVFILDQVKKVARPGDVILLSLEYELFDWEGDTPYWLDESYIVFTASHEPEFLRSRPFGEKVQFMLRLKDRSLMDLWFRPPHAAPGKTSKPSMENWNSNGDEIANTAATKPTSSGVITRIHLPIGCLVSGFSYSPKGFPIIKSFVDWAATNHITVLATYPNLARNPSYTNEPAQESFGKIRTFYESLGIPLLGTAEEAMVPPEGCYNTQYHPTYEYTLQRTQRLLKYLKPQLKGVVGFSPAKETGFSNR